MFIHYSFNSIACLAIEMRVMHVVFTLMVGSTCIQYSSTLMHEYIKV